jgi:hypothetical protein
VRNVLLDYYVVNDIDTAVRKVLRDLGNPAPPLRLEDVRELLRLDKGFYSTNDDSAIKEVIHKLTVAGKQVISRPALLKETILKFNLRALLLPDRKRILIDEDLPDLKKRWCEAHEIGHDLVPWHGDSMMGDNKATLSPGCHEQIEAEANYAAGQLLFLQDRFQEESRSLEVGLKSVRSLNDRYANTITTTLWRYIELSDRVLVGAVSCHPHRPGEEFSQAAPLRYFIRSRGFQERYSRVSEQEIFQNMLSYCVDRSGGPLGASELYLTDDNGQSQRFHFETFFNRYDALTLGAHLSPDPIRIAF